MKSLTNASTGPLCSAAAPQIDPLRQRYWPGICEFLAGAVQRPWHRVWLQRSFTLVIAKAGKFAVWFGCHNAQQCRYS